MAILNADVQNALRAAGLMPQKSADSSSLVTKLEAAGLDLEAVLNDLGALSRGSESEHLRLRAHELILKLHGALKPDNSANETPQINIIIKSGDDEAVSLDFLRPPPVQVALSAETFNVKTPN